MPHRKIAPRRAAPTFALLELPAEIRNLIYAFALTAPSGLRVRWQASTHRRRKKPVMLDASTSHPINQLQYASKQLRRETAGLEIQYNLVTFGAFASRHESALKGLFVFAGRCTPKTLQWLSHVEVREPANDVRSQAVWIHDNMPRLLELLEFCGRNPHIAVGFRLPGYAVKHSGYRFLQDGIFLSRALRGVDVSFLDCHDGQEYEAKVEHVLEERRGQMLRLGRQATNLRILPQETDVDAKTLNEMVRASKQMTRTPKHLLSVRAAEWERYAKTWVEEGI